MASKQGKETEAGDQPASGDLHQLFKEWEKQEEQVDLSDLKPEDSIVFLIFWALFAVVLLQVFTRYVLNDSLGWTEEIARYLLIGVTFVGSVMAMRKGSHIAVEALLKYLPPRARHWMLVLVDATVALFCIFLAWTSMRLAERTNQFMVSIDISKSLIYWFVCAAFVGMSYYAIVRLIRRLRGRESDALHTLTLD